MKRVLFVFSFGSYCIPTFSNFTPHILSLLVIIFQAKVELHVTNDCNGKIKKSKDNCEDRNYTQSCLLKRFSSFLIFDPFHLDFLQLHLLCCIVLGHYVVFCCNAFSRFVAFEFPKNFDQKNAEGNNQAKEQPTVNQLKKLWNLKLYTVQETRVSLKKAKLLMALLL